MVNCAVIIIIYSRLQIQQTRNKWIYTYNERSIESHFYSMYLLHFGYSN